MMDPIATLRQVVIGSATLALSGAIFVSSAQTPSAQQPPGYVVKENVRLVLVPVTVKDRHGSLVDDLTQDDFRVYEDGEQRPIRFFSNGSVPLSAVILLDTGMHEGSLARVRSALQALGNSFAPDDEEALYVFDSTVRLVEDFTSRSELLSELGQKALPEGPGPSLIGGPLTGPPRVNGMPVDRPGTAPVLAGPVGKRINDALYTAVQRLKTRPRGRRRVIVIVSDGRNGSDNDFSYRQTLNALTASEVSVYAVSLGSGWAIRWRDFLARMARETGGGLVYAQRSKGLEQALRELTNEARNTYLLGFTPSSADGELHEIRVRVEHPGVSWIARNRFLAPPQP